MEKQTDKSAKENITGKNSLAMPIIAILLEVFPFIFMQISFFTSFTLLMILLLPIAGFILGVVALREGKAKTGIAGRIIAIIAVALPVLWVGAIIVFLIGATTGMISIM